LVITVEHDGLGHQADSIFLLSVQSPYWVDAILMGLLCMLSKPFVMMAYAWGRQAKLSMVSFFFPLTLVLNGARSLMDWPGPAILHRGAEKEVKV
jgi:hypothetical protein